MTAPHADQLIDGYLARLRAAAADLPHGFRDELIEDMRTHIAEARSRETADETDATILNILDRLGEPSVVVADARERLGIDVQPPARPGLTEFGAIVLLPILWPIGVILLWSSRAWRTRDKVIASLLSPGGYVGFALLGVIAHRAGAVIQWSGAMPIGFNHVYAFLIPLLLLFAPAYLFIRLRPWRVRDLREGRTPERRPVS